MKFNQNDSMEFFQSFLEIINKDGSKINQPNILERYMTGGKTINKHTCKQCNSASSHSEEWPFLCVPLPEYSPMRRMVIDYVPRRLEE